VVLVSVGFPGADKARPYPATGCGCVGAEHGCHITTGGKPTGGKHRHCHRGQRATENG
jgi:hypothetical protein